jgi:competence protein ComEC
MTHWIPFALVRIVIFFIAGVVTALFYPDVIPSEYQAVWLSVFVVLYASLFMLHRRTRNRKFNPGIVALPAIFIAGYFSLVNKVECRWNNHLSQVNIPIDFYQVTLTDFAHEKEKSWKQTGTVTKVQSKGKWQTVKGNILLYFPKQTFPIPFRYGDCLLISGSVTPIPGPSNPGEFDYQKFMSYRQVYHQHFLRDDKVKYICYAPTSIAMALALEIRNVADTQLKSLVEGEREKALASALVLGVVDGLDNDLMNAYAATGAMHVLAVSGLHVGILYWLLLIILKPLKPFQWGRWVIAAICLVALWGYACVTGLSPSVLRAVVMFSFVIVAYPLNFRTNIYNILAASAFCLLLYDPFMIVSVGFQLSYLAVLGIVYLQPLLYRLIEPRNRIIDETWKITCVSLAAQMSTFMLGLLYFRQFPNYFLISNLFVIPLSFIILMTGLAALALSFIPAIGTLLGLCLTSLIKVLNYLVFWVESWPYSLVENIYISAWQALILGGFVLLFCFYLERRRLKYLTFASSLLIIFALCSWQHFASEVSGKRITVYRIPKQTVYDLSEDGTAVTFANIDSTTDKSRLAFNLSINRLMHGISNVLEIDSVAITRCVPGGKFTVWRNVAIFNVIDNEIKIPSGLKIDFAILSGNAIRSLEDVIEKCDPDWIIIDSSNSRSVASDLLEQAKKIPKQRVHSVWHQGAFQVKL